MSAIRRDGYVSKPLHPNKPFDAIENSVLSANAIPRICPILPEPRQHQRGEILRRMHQRTGLRTVSVLETILRYGLRIILSIRHYLLASPCPENKSSCMRKARNQLAQRGIYSETEAVNIIST